MKHAVITLLVGIATLSLSFFSRAADKPTKYGFCEVHRTQMTKTNVPIAYGLLSAGKDAPPYEVIRKQFPHAEDFVGGGCIVMEGQPTTARVDSCVKCREAKSRWLAARKK